MASVNDDFTARLMDDMNPALLDFIKTKVNSFIKWDIVKFFHLNPNTADTAENIARYIGRNEDAVRPEMEKLVASDLINKQPIADTIIYTITEDKTSRDLIRQFVEACEDRHFRVKAVYHILQGMR